MGRRSRTKKQPSAELFGWDEAVEMYLAGHRVHRPVELGNVMGWREINPHMPIHLGDLIAKDWQLWKR